MYKLVQGTQTEKPSTLEIGKTTVYKRRNIERVSRVNELGETEEFWQYEELQMSLRDFALEIAILNPPQDSETFKNLSQTN